MTRKARTVPAREPQPRLSPAFRPGPIGKFGNSRIPVVNGPSKDMGVGTPGVHTKVFGETQARVRVNLENPKMNISAGLAEKLRENDPLEKRVGIPFENAAQALETKRLAEAALKRGPLSHLIDEAKVEAARTEDEMVAASVRSQRIAEFKGPQVGTTRIAVKDVAPELEAVRKETTRLIQAGALSRYEAMLILAQSHSQETVIKIMEGVPK